MASKRENADEDNGDNGPIGHTDDDAAAGHSSSGSDDRTKEAQAPAKPEPKKDEQKKPSKLKVAWDKLGLDVMTLKMMFKGSVPPTVAIAMYQSPRVAEVYTTLGYLVAIASILGFAIMPRGKFIQHMTLNVISICFAAGLNLLALYCATQARINTTPAGQPPSVYNSSQSAVCAVWLIGQVYLINVSSLTSFGIIGSKENFADVNLDGTQFPDMPTATSFMQRLIEAFLSGFALATATHFFIFPTSSRLVVFKELAGYLQLLNGVVKTQTAYMTTLETHDPLKQQAEGAESDKKKHKKKKEIAGQSGYIWGTPASVKMEELMNKLIELHTKLHGDITPAKREFAFGKLESHDLTELWKLGRSIFLPVLGLASMINILERQAELCGWKSGDEVSQEVDENRYRQIENVHEAMKFLHKPFAQMTATLDGAFQHILLVLELVKPPKKKQEDEESKGDEAPKPGSTGFAETYKKKMDEFYNSKKRSLEDFCAQNDIQLPPDFWEASFIHPHTLTAEQEHRRERHQRQLFFVLYLEYLLWRVAKAVLNLVLFVDKRKQEGAFKRSKLIFPGSKTIYKWILSTFGQEDMSQEDSFTTDMDSGGNESLYLGQGFSKMKDPEHEPPRNAFEKLGEKARNIPRFFRSDSSAFGFRVVAATMTLGIVCYLRDTQSFFLDNRLLWSLIMIAISMNRTAGQSSFNFAMRILGTAVAMTASYVIWYIVDGKTPGVIIFLWLWMAIAFYPIFKAPKFIIVAVLSIVTSVLIVGYELQVRVLGVEVATSNGQPAYPLYILAPYRLAAVTCGILVSYIWTIFPFPISESTELRKDLAASLNLMCIFYENVHETVRSRVTGKAGSITKKGTHAYNLEKARTTIFSKLVFVLENLKTNSAFSSFQLRVGGRFPHEEYEELMSCMRRLLLWVSLASYASSDFDQVEEADAERSLWAAEFRKVIGNSANTSNQITSLLSLLASSLSNGQPLPPYLRMPESFQLVRRLEHVNPDIVSVRHVAEPEYSAFAVMQVTSQCINTDVLKLVKHVKNLVGEIDFSYRAVKSSSASSFNSSDEEEDAKSKAE
ncbi:uncharacterized protein LTR77_003423 [Saxophila tyrrhenica]|uniref:ER transporter 6TM N-terminal domain-containing protein n=1 Tax=Saxophila tyrrhenica TaxID=1690608 RepID=A0AAV9PEW9_9PEZI|nr:hypothetical protein LTR77_003423 [Saxophila tyrrhenica]